MTSRSAKELLPRRSTEQVRTIDADDRASRLLQVTADDELGEVAPGTGGAPTLITDGVALASW